MIFTMDIISLYTVIPNSEDLQALKYFFNQRAIKKTDLGNLTPSSWTGDNYYKQINGFAIGTKMGPSYANLVLG